MAIHGKKHQGYKSIINSGSNGHLSMILRVIYLRHGKTHIVVHDCRGKPNHHKHQFHGKSQHKPHKKFFYQHYPIFQHSGRRMGKGAVHPHIKHQRKHKDKRSLGRIRKIGSSKKRIKYNRSAHPHEYQGKQDKHEPSASCHQSNHLP